MKKLWIALLTAVLLFAAGSAVRAQTDSKAQKNAASTTVCGVICFDN